MKFIYIVMFLTLNACVTKMMANMLVRALQQIL